LVVLSRGVLLSYMAKTLTVLMKLAQLWLESRSMELELPTD